MFDKAKNFVVQWLLFGKVKGLLVALNGYKTFTGFIVLVFGTVLAYTGTDSGLFQTVYQQLLDVYGKQPLSDAEIVMLVGQIKIVTGLLHKAYKKITGQSELLPSGLPKAQS